MLFFASLSTSTNSSSVVILSESLRTTAPGLDIQYIMLTSRLSFQDEVKLYLSWLSMSRLTTRISTLHANGRLFGHLVDGRVARNQCGDRGRGGFMWVFYVALERFLCTRVTRCFSEDTEKTNYTEIQNYKYKQSCAEAGMK
ncbi:uncharacterized protein BP01DRAFT_34964 [Aspergillus saccharolyticus JOP 1030-1]|uniref:Uncharacterized protein n=1 Tax=Aspergillus saccharolyticus JOP 1030-1 TaxID=1450539 RepID=A0A318ZGD4_9EURO|nr:hypothetical protein BP01DRAFT_34964 [Aspergillus saccharolyticus JOP 1030-1]PYH46065.1 hypothetical protein BP01DRAFT_34964 [Aspergillus saccharolyticus JOP 1030-1]